ncbi:GNAT family N-acetyltransferase [Halioglobus japonicus]|uniref:N-acetyltransferase n=1 Tax=Halioglobus japonicus TaxID=930805 RepID=A0AAP8SNK8_9GAMM|nr:GNAT family N-acetyltransferase [Halioglobus japonicus]AQA18556.1 GNAT family N-acetyltransferase [Halioglobus japonicus]PLW86581.1 N-acetyltransferase [Halioglobus japonicus]GHD12138.1 N-acetyltransferase [Halioglobus japonicus]
MAELTTWYLEMTSAHQLQPRDESRGLTLAECQVNQWPLNRFLYEFVGASWEWQDKLSWTEQQWRSYVERPELRTWLASCDGSPAGYFELEKQGEDVEIMYFGLAPSFIGRGFGGYLLSQAIRQAWAWDTPSRVWVHTCSQDHPSALANYQARGFTLYNTEVEAI